MTCTRKLLAVALAALALAASPVRAGAPDDGDRLIAMARDDLARGDGLAAEARLRRAMAAGALREEVAAWMGEALLVQGSRDKARDWLTTGRFTRASAPNAYRTLARLEIQDGNLPAAGRAFDKAIALTPNNAEMWVEIGRLRYRGGEHTLALDAADHALRLNPASARALEFKGQIVRDQYGLAAALPWFEAGLMRAREDLSLLGEYAATLGELDRAREMLAVTRQMLRIDPKNARAFYLQAVLAARADNPSLARALLNRTGHRLDAMPGAMLLDAVLDIRAGNHVLAIDTLERLLKRQPANPRAQMLLARAMALAGQHAALVRRFAAQAAQEDAPPYLLTLVARSWEALGQRDLAAPFLDRATRARELAVRPVASGSRLGEMIAQGRLAEAQALAESERAAFPGAAGPQVMAGDVRLAMKDGAGALERYRLAARVRMSESLMLRMVAAHLLAGQRREAEGLVNAWLAWNPTSRAAAREAASLAMARRDWKRAKGLLEFVEARGSGRDVTVLSDLALARLNSGDAPGAARSAALAYGLQRANPAAAEAWGLSLTRTGQHPRMARALLAKARRISVSETPPAMAPAALASAATRPVG